MKNILFVLLFVFIGALLCAETYGEAIDAVLSTGSIDTINGKTSWFPNGMLDSEGDAADYITWVTMVFLYTWADWDDSASASQASKANSVNKVSGGFGMRKMKTGAMCCQSPRVRSSISLTLSTTMRWTR